MTALGVHIGGVSGPGRQALGGAAPETTGRRPFRIVDRTRPGGRPLPMELRSRVVSTACAVRTEPVDITRMVLGAVIAVLLVCGSLVLLMNANAAPVPSATTVVQVHAGETLWDVAVRVAPHSKPASVVGRIQELNGLSGSGLHPGQPLLVPDGA